MNAKDILQYGHSWFLDAIKGLPDDKWEEVGVVGTWSAKDVLSHIASYEIILVDTLKEFVETGKSDKNPIEDHQKFNDDQTAKRRDKNYKDILDEYTNAYEEVMFLIPKISQEKCAEVGTLSWYGSQYCLDDYLVYSYYGHKREHGAQIALFRDKMTK